MLWVVIVILVVIILILAIALLSIIKKATYLSKKDRDFITYVIDIYIDYADELNVSSIEEHEIIVEQLKRIKKNGISDG